MEKPIILSCPVNKEAIILKSYAQLMYMYDY